MRHVNAIRQRLDRLSSREYLYLGIALHAVGIGLLLYAQKFAP